MSKAFVRESDTEEDLPDEPEVQPAGRKNYMTPKGFRDLQDEFKHLMRVERPKVVEVVSWAAGNGDRSENGDYIYGKKRLREVDRRIRFLVRRLDQAEVVDPASRRDDDNDDQVFFGATVTVRDDAGATRRISIVGVDEIDVARGYVSWVSPIARALLKSREGDVVSVQTPAGAEALEVMDVRYDELATGEASA